MKFILVGAAEQDLVTKMLCAGVREYNAKWPSDPVDIELTSYGDCLGFVERHSPDTCLVCVAVSEPVLSIRVSEASPDRDPCTSFATAERLIRGDAERRVCLVSAPTALTGVDVAAAMLLGVAGIVDDRSMVDGDLIKAMITHDVRRRREQAVLLIGQPFVAMQKVMGLVDAWENDGIAGSDPKIDPNCWRACMALAQLHRLVPIARGHGPMYGYTTLAATLNLLVTATGFRMSEVDLRKALSAAARRMLGGSKHDAALRVTLPERVREAGFPFAPPAVETIPYVELVGRMYRLVRDATSHPCAAPVQVPCGTICVHRSLFEQLSGLNQVLPDQRR